MKLSSIVEVNGDYHIGLRFKVKGGVMWKEGSSQ